MPESDAKPPENRGRNRGGLPPIETRWKKGQSGNPGGRPKTKPLTDAYRKSVSLVITPEVAKEMRLPAAFVGMTVADVIAIGQANGVPEEIAMKVTGHRTRAMFGRYNIASLEDKLEALQKASAYATSRERVGSNVVSIESRKSSNGTSTRGDFAEEIGGPRGTRTHDHRLKRPML